MCGKYAIYDFCRTLIDFETADSFVDFICKNKKTKFRYKFLLCKPMQIVSALLGHFTHKSFYKKLNLSRIKGMQKDEIDQYAKIYYRTKIKPHIIQELVKRLQEDKEAGYIIVIVSASYEIFIRLFAEDYGVDLVISNEFKFDTRNRFTGEIVGKDCIYEEKANRAKLELNRRFFQESKAYGDSRSDVPVLNMVGRGIVVSYRKHRNWVNVGNFEEIVWQ